MFDFLEQGENILKTKLYRIIKRYFSKDFSKDDPGLFYAWILNINSDYPDFIYNIDWMQLLNMKSQYNTEMYYKDIVLSPILDNISDKIEKYCPKSD
ncbi:MAG: hypothetical protein PHN88_02750 [Ignavibacteria bacterium]|nr:hypothetical protein [Ignavibacteria bacterium]